MVPRSGEVTSVGKRSKTADMFKNSEICNVLLKDFSRRKTRDFKYAEVEEYTCNWVLTVSMDCEVDILV